MVWQEGSIYVVFFHNEEFLVTKRQYRTQQMKKPKCVVDYNRSMETVERIAILVSDLMLAYV